MSESPEPSSRYTLLIGTYASVPYVHLQLESRKRYYPKYPCIVCDDCSPVTRQLRDLCQSYDAQFYCNPHNLGHSHGDWSFFKYGLAHCNTPYLLKLSRRFVPFANIIETIPDSGQTIGEQAFKHLPFLRSECIVLEVKPWLPSIHDHVPLPVDGKIFVEREITIISKKIYGFKELGYRNNQQYYTPWPLLSFRKNATPFCLWHWNNGTAFYHKLAQTYGLPYTYSDFKNPKDILLPIDHG